MNKTWWITTTSLALSLPFVAADIGTTFNNIWWKILSVGNLSFLGFSDGSAVAALVRILVAILVFTVLFGLAIWQGAGLPRNNNAGPLNFLNRGQAGVVAAIIAIISAIFIPAQILLATGAGWGTLIALILLGGPIVGFLYVIFTFPEEETHTTIFLKIVLCIILYWVLTAMKYHVTRMV